MYQVFKSEVCPSMTRTMTVALRRGAAVAMMLCATTAVAQEYPRLGAYEIAGHKQINNSAYRDSLARHDILILGLWRDWRAADGSDLRTLVKDLKVRANRQNNADILVGKYTVLNEVSASDGDKAKADVRVKAMSERGPNGRYDWLGRTSSGGTTSSWSGTFHTNITNHVRADANGDTFPTWKVRRDYREFFAKVPELDLWYFDNWFHTPRVTADWNGDGSNDQPGSGSVDADFQAGMVKALNLAQALAPNKIMMANVDGNPFTGEGMFNESRYRGKLNGLFEFAIGEKFSVETWGGWSALMDQYRKTVANTKDGMLIFLATGAKTDYQLMRYGLATSLMDAGYYYYTAPLGNGAHLNSAWWYDEYNLKLGKALQGPPTAAWQKGVFMRRFENGMALVNPKGNGRQTVTIPDGYKRLKGNQDTGTNNGQVARSVTLKDRDGLILELIDKKVDTVAELSPQTPQATPVLRPPTPPTLRIE